MAFYWLGDLYKYDEVGLKIHKWLTDYYDRDIESLKTFISTSYTGNLDNFFFNLEPHNHIIFLKNIDNKMICFVQIYDLIQIRVLLSKDFSKYLSVLKNNNFPLIINNAVNKNYDEYNFMNYFLQNGVKLWDKFNSN